MAEMVTRKQLEDAGQDAKTLDAFANGAEGVPNVNRAGADVQNLATIRAQVGQQAAVAAGVYPTPSAGVDPNTGVPAGRYFWVPSARDGELLEFWQNTDGTAQDTGKRMSSADAIGMVMQQSMGYTDDRVNPIRMAFTVTKGYNKFNPAAIRDGFYISSAGNIRPYAGNGCSGFMPVVPGTTVSLRGVRGLTGARFFSAAHDDAFVGELIPGPFPAQVVVPEGAGFLVINLYAASSPSWGPEILVYEGTDFKEWEPYTEKQESKLKADNIDPPLQRIEDQDFMIRVASKNLFNPDDVRHGSYVSSTSKIGSNPGMGCSGFIPVDAAKSYVLSGRRGYAGMAFFTAAADAAYMPDSFRWDTTLPVDVVAPPGATHVVFNLYAPSNPHWGDIMFADGNYPYEPYFEPRLMVRQGAIYDDTPKVLPPGLLVFNPNGESFVSGSGLGYTVRRGILPFPDHRSSHPVWNFTRDFIDGVEVRAGSDDVAPDHVLGDTVAGNHGYTSSLLTIEDHPFTQADVGSIWLINGAQRVLVEVYDADHVVMTNRSSSGRPGAGTFTHVSGGLVTGNVLATASVAWQWRPSFQNHSIEVFVDGKKIPLSGSYGFNHAVSFIEKYEILSKSELVDWVEIHGASGGLPSDLDPSYSITNIYTFDIYGQCTIQQDRAFLKPVPVRDFMMLQASQGGMTTYYVPKSLPFERAGATVNYARGVPASLTSDGNGTVSFTPDVCESEGQLADRLIATNSNGSFAIGFLPIYLAEPAVRRAQITQDAIRVQGGTNKVYFQSIMRGDYVANAGDVYRSVGYRNVFRPGEKGSHYMVAFDGGLYSFSDWRDFSGLDEITFPASFTGRKLEVLESRGATIFSGWVSPNMKVRVDALDDYAYLIVRLE